MPKQRVPSLRHHRPSGLAVVTLSGKDYYCGPWGDRASRLKYDQLVTDWLANGRRPLAKPEKAYTVSDLFRDYLADQGPYVSPAQKAQLQKVLGEVGAKIGAMEPHDVEALHIRQFRDLWHDRGLTRRTIRIYLSDARQPFIWGSNLDLVPPEVVLRVRSVVPAVRGRGSGAPGRKVGPVSEEHFRATLEFISPQSRSLLELLWWTGARIGEWIAFDWPRLERRPRAWLYSPREHKTARHGHERFIFLGPRAQLALGRWEAEAPHPWPFREPKTATNHAINSACKKAGVPRWHPHQIRHSVATRIRERFGVEAARTVLGHSVGNPVTSIYAERDLALAEKVMMDMG